MTSRFGLIVAIPVMVIGGAVSAGGCGGVVNVSAGGAGGNPSTMHSTTNATTGAPSTTTGTMTGSCESACTVMSSCKGGAYATCLKTCQDATHGPCASQSNAWTGCLKANAPQLASCNLSTVCDAAFQAFVACNQQQSPTDAASSVAGTGSGMGGCSAPACGIGVGGLVCECTETCNGSADKAHCDEALGGAVCGCTKGGTYLGSCFDAGGCTQGTTCCSSHF